MRELICGLLLLQLFALPSLAQKESPYTKYGKVGESDLRRQVYSIDSSAAAVVLCDRGQVRVVGNSKSSFSLRYTRHRVVHILKNSAYEMANIEVPLYHQGTMEEELISVKGVTYNLEDNKVVASKLGKDLLTEKRNENYNIKKFALTNVREGSIIEYEYEVSSDFLRHIDPWNFQGEMPVMWSEFVFSAPSFFIYTYLIHGYQPLFIKDQKNHMENLSVVVEREVALNRISETVVVSTGVTDYRFVMKDVPALREESFTSALENHMSRIQFQLAAQSKPLEERSYIEKWTDLTKELEGSEHFGAWYKDMENSLPAEARFISGGTSSQLQRSREIYQYVRDNYNCTGRKGIYTDGTMKSLVKSKKGTAAELNLLLLALLRNAGISSRPVIISTRGHGYVYPQYASLAQFNHLLVEMEVEGKTYHLDASHPFLGFNRLLPEFYNGHARKVDAAATEINFSPDSLLEKRNTRVYFLNDSSGEWQGKLVQQPGYFSSLEIRQELAQKGLQEWSEDLEKKRGNNISIRNVQIDSLSRLDGPIELSYDLQPTKFREGLIYLNPFFGNTWGSNPFSAAKRNYPVEMSYRIDETYLLTMEVPKGYEVDELPKQILAKMDEENSGYFEYRVSHSDGIISMRMILRINRTFFYPDEYDKLRQFFSLFIAKQSEQIVLKKKG